MTRKPKPSPIHLGNRLAELRKEAGYTQVQIAETIGTSQRMVSYYEKTADHPLAKLLRHYSTALNVSTDDLLGTAPTKANAGRRPPGKPHGSSED